MGKKRKAPRSNDQPKGPREVNDADARLGPVTTYADVANSEDEFFLARDNLMLDDEPDSKRVRRADDDIELSDEEVLGYDESESEDERPKAKSKKGKKGSKAAASSDEEDEGDDAEGDEGWWGASRKEYYNADNIETEADALEEEAEAKRLQQKKLSKMTDEDFIFDQDEWLEAEPEKDAESEDKVTEVLKDIEITDDMGVEERHRLLKARYPEFEHLVKELEVHHPLLDSLRAETKNSSGKSLSDVKYWVLGCYVAALASYFAVMTSPARDASKAQKSLDPSELRDHEIMETLLSCREAWRKVKDLKSSVSVAHIDADISLHDIAEQQQEESRLKKLKKAKSREEKAAAAKRARKLEKAKAVEETVADLYNLPIGTSSNKKIQKKVADKQSAAAQDSDSDFGEEATLDDRTAADKAARKKSLKFYTSQIAQKANRRAGAGRDAGGDMDIPYRERLRDRQTRLLAEAEKRGQKGSKHGADLGDGSDEEDGAAAKAMRNNEDEYYDMVAHKAKGKKEDKAARYAAYAAASKADRVVEDEEIGEDGKRKITYKIEKNKGLAPRRKKEVRNPRVKRRMQYEARQKKLRSMKPTWKGGEPKGGYQGELSGINTRVIKSVNLS